MEEVWSGAVDGIVVVVTGGVAALLVVTEVRRAISVPVSVPESGPVPLEAGTLLLLDRARDRFKHLEDKFSAAVVMPLRLVRSVFRGLVWMRTRTSQMPVKNFADIISTVYDIPRHTIGP